MPAAYSEVKFRFGTKAEFNSISNKDPNSLYFITDTHQIYLGNVSYAANALTLDSKPVQLDAGQEGAVYACEEDNNSYAYVGGRWVNVQYASNSNTDNTSIAYDTYTNENLSYKVFNFKGTVKNTRDLPALGNTCGDVYYSVEGSKEYVFVNNEWKLLGALVETYAGIADEDYVEDSVQYILEQYLG